MADHAEVPSPWLTTARLALRRFVSRDLDDLCRLDADPRVMRYVGDGRPRSREEVGKSLSRILALDAAETGLGVWHASRRDDDTFVGWFCLKHPPSSLDVEIGYRLLPQAWGMGFATEGARALVAYAFGTLKLDRVVAVTHPDNGASQRVLAKAGLTDQGWGCYYDRDLRLFAIVRTG